VNSSLNNAVSGDNASRLLSPKAANIVGAWFDRNGKLIATLTWSLTFHAGFFAMVSPWIQTDSVLKLSGIIQARLEPVAQVASLKSVPIQIPMVSAKSLKASMASPINAGSQSVQNAPVTDEKFYPRSAVERPAELLASLDPIFFFEDDPQLYGKVIIALAVRRDGTLADCKVEQITGEARLEQKLKDWVCQQRFDPAVKNGALVNSILTVEMNIGVYPVKPEALGHNHNPGYRMPQDEKGNAVPDRNITGLIIRDFSGK
jgi:hypothetical protein